MVSVNAASGFLLSLAAQKQRGKGHHTTTTQHLFPAAPVVLPMSCNGYENVTTAR